MTNENRTPTPGKNPWMARPRAYENEAVTVEQAAAPVDEGYTRDVVLSQVIDEPGKGGKNPPRREIRTRMHSDDALTLGLHLVENALSAERRNAHNGAGDQRERYFEHPAGHDERRMKEDYARVNQRLVDAVLARLQDWQGQHSDVADYRVTGAIKELTTASSHLRYLADDTTPDLDAARRELSTKKLFTDDEYPTGATGDLPASRRVPRLTSAGRYYVTATRSIPVTVVGVSTTSVMLTVRGEAAEDYPDGITVPRAELGTWLTLDNPADWVTTDA